MVLGLVSSQCSVVVEAFAAHVAGVDLCDCVPVLEFVNELLELEGILAAECCRLVVTSEGKSEHGVQDDIQSSFLLEGFHFLH